MSLLRKYWLAILIALVLALPLCVCGLPSGYDATTHVSYLHYFSDQFWHGDLAPQWLVDANHGLGSPVFVIQYPLPYYLGALLRPVLRFPADARRESREIAVLIVLITIASALSSRSWFGQIASPKAATAGVLIYLTMPYLFGLVVYGRVALGELFMFIWMPLSFRICHIEQPGKFVACFSAVTAGMILSQPFGAFLFLPAVLVYYLYVSPEATTIRSRLRRTLPVISGFTLGAGLAGFYVVPLAWHSKLFDLAGIARYSPSFQFGQHFVFVPAIDFLHLRLPLILAMALLFAVAAAFCIAMRRKPRAVVSISLLGITLLAAVPRLAMPAVKSAFEPSTASWNAPLNIELLATLTFTLSIAVLARAYIGSHAVADMLLALSGFAVVSMLPWSAWFWRVLRPLQTIQFPWRLCALLCVFAAGLLVLALDRGPRAGRLILIGAWVFVVPTCLALWSVDASTVRLGNRAKPIAQFDSARPDPMGYAYVNLASRPKFRETVEASSNVSFASLLSGQGRFRVERAGTDRIVISSEAVTPIVIRLRQFYFPLWSSDRGTLRAGQDGLMELSLPPGTETVNLAFASVRRWGVGLTLTSLLVVCGKQINDYRSRHVRPCRTV